MIDPERWAEARRLKRVEGMSIRAIAGHLSVDRKTVRKALAQDNYPGLQPRKPHRRKSILDPFKDAIRGYLQEAPTLTGMQVMAKLVREHGYTGEITLVRNHLREFRRKEAEAFLRMTYLPGECAQVDWATIGRIPVGRTRRRLSAFVMVLAYSRLMYVELTLSERMDAFLEAHVRAFQYIGGIPRRLVYDNCKTVVLDRRAGKVRFHPRILDFAGHFLFKVRPCPPRKPWHKGLVESGIGYLRKSFLRGRHAPVDLQREQRAVALWRDDVANQRLHQTTRRKPRELFDEAERGTLLPLPQHPYDTAHVDPSVSANRFFRVAFDGNRYSVPYRYAHQRGLLLKATMDQVRIYHGADGLIATHKRSYGRGEDVLEDEHQRGLIQKKRRAERDTLLGRLIALLGREVEDYAGGLVKAERRPAHHLQRLLRLTERYGPGDVRAAMLHALAYGAFGADYVERGIHQARRRRLDPPLSSLPDPKDQKLNRITLAEPDLGHFDELLKPEERMSHGEHPQEENPHGGNRDNPEGPPGSRK